jgi:hypothetical protein
MYEMSDDSVELALCKVSYSVKNLLNIASRPIESNALVNLTTLGTVTKSLMIKASYLKGVTPGSTPYNRVLVASPTDIISNINSSVGLVNSVCTDTPSIHISRKSIRYLHKVLNSILSHLSVTRLIQEKHNGLFKLVLVAGTKNYSPELWKVVPVDEPILRGTTVGTVRSITVHPANLSSIVDRKYILCIAFKMLSYTMLRTAKEMPFVLNNQSVVQEANKMISLFEDILFQDTEKLKEILGEDIYELVSKASSSSKLSELSSSVQYLISAVSRSLLRLLQTTITLPNLQVELDTSEVLILPDNVRLHQILSDDFSIEMSLSAESFDGIVNLAREGVLQKNLSRNKSLREVPGVTEIVEMVKEQVPEGSVLGDTYLYSKIHIPSTPNNNILSPHLRPSELDVQAAIEKITSNLSELSTVNTWRKNAKRIKGV